MRFWGLASSGLLLSSARYICSALNDPDLSPSCEQTAAAMTASSAEAPAGHMGASPNMPSKTIQHQFWAFSWQSGLSLASCPRSLGSCRVKHSGLHTHEAVWPIGAAHIHKR